MDYKKVFEPYVCSHFFSPILFFYRILLYWNRRGEEERYTQCPLIQGALGRRMVDMTYGYSSRGQGAIRTWGMVDPSIECGQQRSTAVFMADILQCDIVTTVYSTCGSTFPPLLSSSDWPQQRNGCSGSQWESLTLRSLLRSAVLLEEVLRRRCSLLEIQPAPRCWADTFPPSAASLLLWLWKTQGCRLKLYRQLQTGQWWQPVARIPWESAGMVKWLCHSGLARV